jgi:predicted SAM-dependent methyltransferase
MAETKKVKYNIGSNDIRIDGYLNVDIRDIPAVDIVNDVRTLSKIKNGSADEILALNILGCIPPDECQFTVNTWVSKLKYEGQLIIGAPDGVLIFNEYKAGNLNWEGVVHNIFGNMKLYREWHGPEAPYYMGHNLFSHDYLKSIMEKAGLSDIIELPQNHGYCLTLCGTKR